MFLYSGGMKSGIIGGNEVDRHSRPYMASVQFKKAHMCGGFLIRKDYVLTAAHCVEYVFVLFYMYKDGASIVSV